MTSSIVAFASLPGDIVVHSLVVCISAQKNDRLVISLRLARGESEHSVVQCALDLFERFTSLVAQQLDQSLLTILVPSCVFTLRDAITVQTDEISRSKLDTHLGIFRQG